MYTSCLRITIYRQVGTRLLYRYFVPPAVERCRSLSRTLHFYKGSYNAVLVERPRALSGSVTNRKWPHRLVANASDFFFFLKSERTRDRVNRTCRCCFRVINLKHLPGLYALSDVWLPYVFTPLIHHPVYYGNIKLH